MKLTDLRPNKARAVTPKRMGRGHAAGQGKTCGRGQKGQKARTNIKPGFEGGQTPLFRRLPSLRGTSNKAHNIGMFRKEFAVVNVEALNRFDPGTVVDVELLLATRVVRKREDGVKILGGGKLDRALTVKAQAFSASARAAIEQAGGTAEVIGP
jgi:large subunit ribosomal protein L15